MSIQKENSDIISMNKIENISKKISDLINLGKYDRISNLDKLRLDLIKKFNDKNNKNFKQIISDIQTNNVKNIELIEIKHKALKAERSIFAKRLKAYNY